MLDLKILSSVVEGDKIEVHDTRNDRVCQGWVESVRVFTGGHRHNRGPNAGEDCFGEIVFRGDAAGYAYHLFGTDEVRILVKKPVPPKAGDPVYAPVAAEFPIGTVLQRNERGGAFWVVLFDGGSDTRRFINMKDCRRKHNIMNGHYKIVRFGND